MSERPDPPDQRRAGTCHNKHVGVLVMTKAGLSPTRLRRKVLALCAEANYVGDLISELAHEARDQQKALLLAGRAHRIAIEAVSPEIFGHVFATDEGEED
jgi:hypothetical protein